jgi:hypothetical protein
MARRRFNFGGIGGFLVIKLVKPVKAVCSGAPHQVSVDNFLPPQTESEVRAGAAGILRKADATVREKPCRFNSPDRVFHQVAELLALLVGYRSPKVLDFDQTLAHKHHLATSAMPVIQE